LDSIEFSYEITQADLFSAQRWFVFRRQKMILAPLAASVGLALMSLSYGKPLQQAHFVSIAVGAILAVLVLFVLPWMRFRWLKPGQRAQRGRMTESSVEFSNDHARGNLEWRLLTAFAARREGLYFFSWPATLLFMPQRAFTSVEDLEAAARLAAEKIKPPRRSVGKVFLWVVLLLLFFSFYSIFSRQRPHADRPRQPPADSR
jgi:hypothetical protein